MEKATRSRPTWSLLSSLSELLSSLLFAVQSSRGSSEEGEDPYQLQIGRSLYLQGLRDSESHGCDVRSSSSLSKNFREMDSSSEDEDQGTHQCDSGSSKDKIPLPEGVVESLMNGQLNLPYSKEFSLPPAVPCLGAFGEAYYCRCNKEKTVSNHLRSFARRNLEQAKSLVQAVIKREEKKREVMDNEVMLQRIQMKYKHETEFLEDSLALSRLAPYSSKFVSSEEEFFESDMMTSHPHSRPSVVQIHPSYDANPAMLLAVFSINNGIPKLKDGKPAIPIRQHAQICISQVHRWPRMGGHRFIGMKTQHQKLTRKCEVTAILVLYGLPNSNQTGSRCDSEEGAVDESNGNKDAMDLEIRSRGNVVGKLVRTKHHKEITFPLVINSSESKPIRFKKNSCTYG
ncbi:hypothetical protein AHAS_Ahas19G0196800 [Arachis hypogaea]